MIMHNVKSATNDVQKSRCIPESVLKAEKLLRMCHPHFYRMISGYRNFGNADYIDRIEIMADVTGERWLDVKWIVLMFLNTTEDNIRESIPHKKTICRSGRKRAA